MKKRQHESARGCGKSNIRLLLVELFFSLPNGQYTRYFFLRPEGALRGRPPPLHLLRPRGAYEYTKDPATAAQSARGRGAALSRAQCVRAAAVSVVVGGGGGGGGGGDSPAAAAAVAAAAATRRRQRRAPPRWRWRRRWRWWRRRLGGGGGGGDGGGGGLRDTRDFTRTES